MKIYYRLELFGLQKVFIPQDITDAGKNFLKGKGYELIIGTGTDIETMLREGAGADAVLARMAPFPREFLEKMPGLKVIGRHGIGVDNIDLAACAELGIAVTYTPLSNANSVAEHAVYMLLACARNAVRHDKFTRTGQWAMRDKLMSVDVAGKTLGVVGFGRIGQSLAKKAVLGMEMNVIAYDAFVPAEKYPEYVKKAATMEEVFQSADFVSLHTPATPETIKMVNRQLLALMKPTSYLINCARGEIVDEAALCEALKYNMIAGAALDVFDPEPPSSDNPLFDLENLIVSPHNASHTNESMDRMGLHAAMGIHSVLSGATPEWPINTGNK